MRQLPLRLLLRIAAGLVLGSIWVGPTMALAQSPFAGIYMGTFISACDPDDGQFAALVKSDGTALFLDFDRINQEGGLTQGVIVNSDGSFTFTDIDGAFTTVVTGNFTTTGVSGNYTVNVVCPGTFSGTKTADDSTFPAQAAGFYTGSVNGTVIVQGLSGSFTSSGPLHAIIAENGQIMAFSSATADITGVGPITLLAGGFLEAALNGTISGSLLGAGGNGATITGVVDTAAFTASGNFFSSFLFDGVPVTHNGSWSINRTIGPPISNTPPVATDDGYLTIGDTVLVVPAPGVLGNDSDSDGDTLSAVLASTAPNGTLALNADGGFTYTPNGGFVGPDSFTYRANDGTVDGNPATVTITVEAPPPKAMPWLSLLLGD